MGLVRTVSEIKGDFSRNQIFFPRVFNSPAEGAPLAFGYRRLELKNWNDAATGPTKKFDDTFSSLDTIHKRDGRTDGRRPTANIALIRPTHSVAR